MPSPTATNKTLPLTIDLVPIANLIPDPNNARQHPEKHVKQLARSIEVFGFTCPVLIDRINRVIAGHGRLLAVRHLGWAEVPAIRLEHLTADQVRAYAIADNRLSDCSTWDDRLLAEQLKALSEADLDFELGVIGFDLPEIDLRIQSLGEVDDEPDASEEPACTEPPVSVLGDVWHLGAHRIVCGSALDAHSYALALGDQKADAAFIDPPYNVPISGHVTGKGQIQHPEFLMASGEMSRDAFTDFLAQALAQLKQHSNPGALLYCAMDWRHLGELTSAGERHALELKNLCIWDKGCGGMGSLYRSQHELIFVYKAGDAPHTNNVQLGRYGRNRTNVWSYPGVNSFARETSEGNLLALHPTVKPVALVADAILDASDRGDRILDSFLGSGTTLIAAEKTGRIGLGIELDPIYVDVAVRRWQRLTGRQATHATTGMTFEQTTQARAPLSHASAQAEGAMA